jgi:hypothetical protein
VRIIFATGRGAVNKSSPSCEADGTLFNVNGWGVLSFLSIFWTVTDDLDWFERSAVFSGDCCVRTFPWPSMNAFSRWLILVTVTLLGVRKSLVPIIILSCSHS